MICGCIDIGSNTTRLLVAELEGPILRELAAEREFTRLGAAVGPDGRISGEAIGRTAETVAAQAARARALGVRDVVVVGTAAVRRATNARELADALRARCGVHLRILDSDEEARLSFAGATRGADPNQGAVAVVDVGGGSTELACGVPGRRPGWLASLPIGSGGLADECLRSDPPTPSELNEVRACVADALANTRPPPAERAAAVGGTATSLHRLVGNDLAATALAAAAQTLCALPSTEAAERFGIAPERVRLLPAGILILEGVAGVLDVPLEMAAGGLREGVLLELADTRAG